MVVSADTKVLCCEYCKYYDGTNGDWCGPWYDEDDNLKWHELYGTNGYCIYWEFNDKDYEIDEGDDE